MLKHAARAAPSETGGLLLGYWSETRREAVVLEASGPGPDAAETKNSFTPDYEHDIRIAEQRFRESPRTHRYLGDWHSHPDTGVYLSPDDASTLRTIAYSEEAHIATPLMIVVGRGEERRNDDWYVGASVWLGVAGYSTWYSEVIEPVPVRLFA